MGINVSTAYNGHAIFYCTNRGAARNAVTNAVRSSLASAMRVKGNNGQKNTPFLIVKASISAALKASRHLISMCESSMICWLSRKLCFMVVKMVNGEKNVPREIISQSKGERILWDASIRYARTDTFGFRNNITHEMTT